MGPVRRSQSTQCQMRCAARTEPDEDDQREHAEHRDAAGHVSTRESEAGVDLGEAEQVLAGTGAGDDFLQDRLRKPDGGRDAHDNRFDGAAEGPESHGQRQPDDDAARETGDEFGCVQDLVPAEEINALDPAGDAEISCGDAIAADRDRELGQPSGGKQRDHPSGQRGALQVRETLGQDGGGLACHDPSLSLAVPRRASRRLHSWRRPTQGPAWAA